MENSAIPNIVRKDKEDLKHSLDLVIRWIDNCDQKASILLAVIGVVLSILFTSDFFRVLRHYIFFPFVQWLDCTDGTIGVIWGRLVFFVFLLITFIFLGMSCCYLLKVLKPSLNYDLLRQSNPHLVARSFLYYMSIDNMTYDNYLLEDVDYLQDLKSQIYINSKIASEKFLNYSRGLFYFKITVLSSIVLFLSAMYMQ